MQESLENYNRNVPHEVIMRKSLRNIVSLQRSTDILFLMLYRMIYHNVAYKYFVPCENSQVNIYRLDVTYNYYLSHRQSCKHKFKM